MKEEMAVAAQIQDTGSAEPSNRCPARTKPTHITLISTPTQYKTATNIRLMAKTHLREGVFADRWDQSNRSYEKVIKNLSGNGELSRQIRLDAGPLRIQDAEVD
jgi:hypothetical protein